MDTAFLSSLRTPVGVADQPARVIEGPRYTETAALPVTALAGLVRAELRTHLTEMKRAGGAPLATRLQVRHSWDGGGMQSITVTVLLPAELPAGTDRVALGRAITRELEPLRAAFNRETLNTPADRCRYYGETVIGA